MANARHRGRCRGQNVKDGRGAYNRDRGLRVECLRLFERGTLLDEAGLVFVLSFVEDLWKVRLRSNGLRQDLDSIGVPYRIRTGVAAVREGQRLDSAMSLDVVGLLNILQ